MHRRDFLKLGFASPLILASLPSGIAYGRGTSPLRVGLVGTGWYGKIDLFRLLQTAPVEVTALCDVNRSHLIECGNLTAARQQSGNHPALYADWREMYSKEKFDLLLIDTPDHWHALPAVAAIDRGIPLWLQKPIGVDVAECRALTEAAEKSSCITQVGLQRRSTPHLMEMKKEFFDSGILGHIGEVEIFSYYGQKDLLLTPTAPPEGFDDEMWTGPAPKLPFYAPIENGGWRSFMEYGNGTLGDMGVHMFDMTRWLMGLGWPQKIVSAGGQYVNTKGVQNIPDTQTVIFSYSKLQVVWNHRHWGGVPDPRHPWGACFRGTNGTLKASVFGWDFYLPGKTTPDRSADVLYELDAFPEDKDEPRIELHTAPGIRRQFSDLVSHIQDGDPQTVCPIKEGAVSTASCILGNISLKLGRTLEWDSDSWQVKNDDEANQLLARPYRNGWVHP